MDTEHLFMITNTWLEHLQYEEVDVEITEILYNATCTPKSFFVEIDSESWNPKIHIHCSYFKSFYISLMNAVPLRIVLLKCLEMVYKKRQDHLINS